MNFMPSGALLFASPARGAGNGENERRAPPGAALGDIGRSRRCFAIKTLLAGPYTVTRRDKADE
jgi:hypothetical protein